MKRIFLVVVSAAVTVAMNMTVFAGVELGGERGNWQQDGAGWKWQYEDGSYADTGWHWLDGDEDGKAECYFFDGSGCLLTGTTTPDGLTVNEDGAFTQDGVVRKMRIKETWKSHVKNVTAADIDPNLEDDVYNKYGINKTGMEMVCQSREENAVYGEVSEVSKYGYDHAVTYENGFVVTYFDESVPGSNHKMGQQTLEVDLSRTDLNNNYLLKFYFDNHQEDRNRIEDSKEKEALLEELGFNVIMKPSIDSVRCEFNVNNKTVVLHWLCNDTLYLYDTTPQEITLSDPPLHITAGNRTAS